MNYFDFCYEYLNTIPQTRVRYEMIDANEERSAEFAIIISYPTSTSGIVVLLKNNQEKFLDLADFALQYQPQDNLMVAISRAWYNGSYTIGR